MKVRASVAFLILLLGYTTAKAGQPPGTWQPAHDMNESRASHTATLLADGTVLVAGGYQSGMSREVLGPLGTRTPRLRCSMGRSWSLAASVITPG